MAHNNLNLFIKIHFQMVFINIKTFINVKYIRLSEFFKRLRVSDLSKYILSIKRYSLDVVNKYF